MIARRSYGGPRTIAAAGAALAALGAPAMTAQAQPSGDTAISTQVSVAYTVTDLGTFGGELSNAHGINDLGEVVGVAETPTTAIKGFLWRDGELIDLGGLSETGTGTQAYEVNDRSEVVGYSLAPDPEFSARTAMPFYWSADTGMVNLGHDLTHSGRGDGRDINNAGKVVGTWRSHPFTWTAAGGYSEMSLIPGAFFDQAEALAVNESGVSVGFGSNPEAWTRPVRWQPDGNAEELPVLEDGRYGRANDINAAGMMVGEADKAAGGFVPKPVIWHQDGSIEEIPLIPADPPLNMGMAEGVADDGTSIGWDMSADFGDGRQVGWIRTPEGTKTALNDLIDLSTGWDIRIPLDINSSGQIVGIGIMTRDGVTYPGRAFLMTPLPVAGTASVRWHQGSYYGDLAWEGPSGGQVEVYRDDQLVATTDNDGSHTDPIGNLRMGTVVTYRLCITRGDVCSADLAVELGHRGRRQPATSGLTVTFLGGRR
ncbi:MAG: hypothetical protein GEU96_08900 [Propionibacteriales bacterium]|nr:hypothetical protein [Propionibacteriales bacterium]